MTTEVFGWVHPKVWALPVEILGSAYLVGAVARAAQHLLGSADPDRLERARLTLADGVVTSLSFKAAASLLKILEVQTWSQIGLFAAVLALRTGLKAFFKWEAGQVRRSMHPSAPAALTPGHLAGHLAGRSGQGP